MKNQTIMFLIKSILKTFLQVALISFYNNIS